MVCLLVIQSELTSGFPVSVLSGLYGREGYSNGLERAMMKAPCGLCQGDYDGSVLLCCDSGNQCIRRVSIKTGEMLTVVGTPGTDKPCDGNHKTARLLSPKAITRCASSGICYFVDCDGIRILHTDDSVTTLAGTTADSGFKDGPNLEAKFRGPLGIIIDPRDSNRLFVADTYNHCIRLIDLKKGVSSLYAGVPRESGFVDDTKRLSAKFDHPQGLAFDTNGALYVCDHFNHRIRRIVEDEVTTVAGRSAEQGFMDGNALTTASLYYPEQLCFDSSDRCFISDAYGIRTLEKGQVKTMDKDDIFKFSSKLAGMIVIGSNLFAVDTEQTVIYRIEHVVSKPNHSTNTKTEVKTAPNPFGQHLSTKELGPIVSQTQELRVSESEAALRDRVFALEERLNLANAEILRLTTINTQQADLNEESQTTIRHLSSSLSSLQAENKQLQSEKKAAESSKEIAEAYAHELQSQLKYSNSK